MQKILDADNQLMSCPKIAIHKNSVYGKSKRSNLRRS